MIFSEKLMQRRKALGMTQEDLAERLDVSRQTVGKWENGDFMPDADKFIRLADILEISMDELAGREVEVEPIVLPAPEVPQPGKVNRRLLISVIACLLVLTIGLVLGKYVFPNGFTSVADESTLPDTLTVTSFDIKGTDAHFTADVSDSSLQGTVYLYNEAQDPLGKPVKYSRGVCSISDIPEGVYDKMVFVITDGDKELSALLAENITIEKDGSSYTPVVSATTGS